MKELTFLHIISELLTLSKERALRFYGAIALLPHIELNKDIHTLRAHKCSQVWVWQKWFLYLESKPEEHKVWMSAILNTKCVVRHPE